MVLYVAVFLWPLISGGTAPFSRPGALALFSYYAIRGALSLLTAAILLWSKQFAYEFAKLRETEPKYIPYLRALLIGTVIVAALIAIFNDIASSP
jgi:hypothetical protein